MRPPSFRWASYLLRGLYGFESCSASTSTSPILRPLPFRSRAWSFFFVPTRQYSSEMNLNLAPDLLEIMEQRMLAIEHKIAHLQEQINQPAATASEYSRANKELRRLGSSPKLIKEVRAKRKEIDSLKLLMSDSPEDKDMCDMASEELAEAIEEEKRLLHSLLKSLIPKDDADEKDCILEVRAGTGGEEASLFAMDIFNMYEKYSQKKGWRFDVIEIMESDLKGYKMASGSGDQPPRRSFLHTFRSRKSRATSGGASPSTTAPATTSATTPHTPVPATTGTPAAVGPSTHVYHTPDPCIPPGYPYTSHPPPPSTYPYPPHAYYPPPPHYSTPTPYPAVRPDAPTPAVPAGPSQDTRQYIEPEGDTFNPPKQATNKIRDLIRSNFDAPYLSWKKIPQAVRDMWFREFERAFYWEPQYRDRVRRNFEHRGSVRMRDMFTDIRKSAERPLWIGERVWADLCAAWESPAYVKKREQNKQNRASDCGGAGTSLHTGGARSHTEYRRQLAASLGREPTMSELHALTHQRRDTQEWVDARAKQVNEEYTRLREQQSQSSIGEGSSAASTYPPTDYDIWTQAVGGKKKGRTYGLGSQGPAFDAQSTYTSPSDYTGQSVRDIMMAQEKMHQDLQQQQQQMQDQMLHQQQQMQDQMLQHQQQMQDRLQHQQQLQEQQQQQIQEMLRLLQQHMPPPPQPPQPPQQGDDDDDAE